VTGERERVILLFTPAVVFTHRQLFFFFLWLFTLCVVYVYAALDFYQPSLHSPSAFEY
jgi:hypothetical protein